MSGRLRRFLHLERPRDAAPTAPAAGGERFAGLEAAPDTPWRASPGPARTDTRFGPERAASLELAERVAGARPFRRCMACGRDHGLHEATCACGAALDTAEVEAWNERLWAERRAEEAREAADAEAARAAAAREAEELAKLRREMGIELARQVGERERARLGMGGGERALGVRLLGVVPERWRLHALVAAGTVELVLVLVALARRSPGPAFLAVALAVLLLAPPGRSRRRWWDGS